MLFSSFLYVSSTPFVVISQPYFGNCVIAVIAVHLLEQLPFALTLSISAKWCFCWKIKHRECGKSPKQYVVLSFSGRLPARVNAYLPIPYPIYLGGLLKFIEYQLDTFTWEEVGTGVECWSWV